MLDEQTPAEADQTSTPDNAGGVTESGAGEAAPPAPRKRTRKSTAKKATPPPEGGGTEPSVEAPPEADAEPAKKTAARKRATRKTAAPVEETVAAATAEAPAAAEPPAGDSATDTGATEGQQKPAKRPAAKRTAAKKTTSRTRRTAASDQAEATPSADDAPTDGSTDEEKPAAVPLFQAPPEAPAKKTAAKRTRKTAAKKSTATAADQAPGQDEDTPGPAVEPAARQDDERGAGEETTAAERSTAAEQAPDQDADGTDDTEESEEGQPRRRRRRGGRRRRRGGSGGGSGSDSDDSGESEDGEGADDSADSAETDDADDSADRSGASSDNGEGGSSSSSRRRRRRRRSSDSDGDSSDDPDNTVTRVRKGRTAEDEITGFTGSTRLEAKKQRRREGREAGRRRAPIISEAEFLARRESVDRKMVIRQRGDLTQIAVLEDKVLVEHYVARESQTSLIGNVYLGRVQNVLPSMEAAFIDIGKGRNAVLYAGEVNWDALGAKDGSQRKIEQVLKSGQPVLVQVTKDPIGHKGARLTSQISLPGRFLVYVPDGTTSGISRKLPDKERTRLKTLLKEIVPEDAGVIVRTAAEGADEKELVRDVERLKALWEDISSKVEKGNAPQLLYGEPDLTLKVVRDLFTEDIGKLVVSGDDAWEMVDNYVRHIAPDLVDRLERHDESESDAFAAYRIDEQIAKALDRKVWLPSGGSLVIDRTEAMTVVDVNTGKFTGSGGNLEETVTKNNLEAAEEIVRQLRLRDIGGIIVVDFIDMVLESNRDLVLRRLVECLGRDRTRHQVAEVTSLGLVQMTRKRIGTGLLEAFSESCEHCQGRGLVTHHEPVEPKKRQQSDEEPRRNRRGRGRGRPDEQGNGSDAGSGAGRDQDRKQSSGKGSAAPEGVKRPTPAEFAAMARAEAAASSAGEVVPADAPPATSEDDGTEPRTGPTEASETQSMEAPEAPEAPAEPAAPEAPAEPAAPRIVTSVRRVGARRAAGPPVQDSTPAQSHSPTAAEGPADSDDASPAVAGGVGDGDLGPTEEGDAPDPEQGQTQVHVPVKKKGTRKR